MTASTKKSSVFVSSPTADKSANKELDLITRERHETRQAPREPSLANLDPVSQFLWSQSLRSLH
jgi:hypothetical protein